MIGKGDALGTLVSNRLLVLLLEATFVVLFVLLVVIIAHASASASPLLGPAEVLAALLAGLAIATTVSGVLYAHGRYPAERNAIYFIVIITFGVLLAHAYVVNNPSGSDCLVTVPVSVGCIMDEGVYYAPAASLILNGTQCGVSAAGAEVPGACNLEHPYLAKAFIAAGMAVFGTNVAGVRLFEVLLGTFSLPLLYLLAVKMSGDRRLGYVATLFFAFDVMFFVHSSTGLIDVQQVFFVLLGLVMYAYAVKVWRLDRYLLAGIFFGVAGLSKETAAFAVLGFATFVLVFGVGNLRWRLLSTIKFGVAVAVVFAVGMQIYDSLFASGSFPIFVSHVSFLVRYASGLNGPALCSPANAGIQLATGGYWCKYPDIPQVATPILPQDWVVYYEPVKYYVSQVCVGAFNGLDQCVGHEYTKLGYWGVTNYVVTWLVFIWLPLAGYSFYKAVKAGTWTVRLAGANLSGELRLAGLAGTMFLWSYLPYFWVQYGLGRVTYPFYTVPLVPFLAIGAAYFLTRRWVPERLLYVYVAAAFLFFFVFYPDKSFLPVYVRSLLFF